MPGTTASDSQQNGTSLKDITTLMEKVAAIASRTETTLAAFKGYLKLKSPDNLLPQQRDEKTPHTRYRWWRYCVLSMVVCVLPPASAEEAGQHPHY